MKRCSVDQCEAKHMARGLCQKHYNAIYHAMIRKGEIKNRGSFYPQAVIPVPVSGWGYLLSEPSRLASVATPGEGRAVVVRNDSQH